jgi:hypothetical protein
MRKASVLVVLSLVAAAGAAAGDRNPAIRVFVQAAEGAPPGSGDSALDVQELLRQQKPDSVLAIAAAREGADLVLEITGRRTERKMDYGRTPAMEVTFSIVQGALLGSNPSLPLKGESSMIVKSWRDAAAHLVGAVAGYAEDVQHSLLRRRADWPDVGFEFEELTKERKREFGAKDGKAVVTAVRPEGAAQKAGLQGGDAILSLNDKKLKDPAELGRAIYGGAPGASLRLEVAQRGARRTVTLVIP